MSNKFRTESVFWYKGYKCVTTFGYVGHRCGYVAVTPDHPLFGVDYRQDLCSPELLKEIKASNIGKRGIIDLVCWDGEASTLNMIVNVHGGLTYAQESWKANYPMNQFDRVWYFGFDCGHCGDNMDRKAMQKYFVGNHIKIILEIEAMYPTGGVVRSLEYVQQECKNLVEYLDCVAQTLIQTRTLLAERTSEVPAYPKDAY